MGRGGGSDALGGFCEPITRTEEDALTTMHKRCNTNANIYLFSVLFVADIYFCFGRIAILNVSAARDVL